MYRNLIVITVLGDHQWNSFLIVKFAIVFFRKYFAMNSMDPTQQIKDELRARFSAKLENWINSKKQSPSIKKDEMYAQIVTAVEKWSKDERFTDDKTNYNYGSR